MFTLKRIPMLAICLSFLLGIILHTSWSDYYIPIGIITGILSCLILVGDHRYTSLGYEVLFSVCVCVCFAMMGAGNIHLSKKLNPNELDCISTRRVQLGGVIISPVTQNEYGVRYQTRLFAYQQSKTTYPIRGKIQTYAPAVDSTPIHMHDTIYFDAYVKPLTSPHAGYMAYMNSQGIYHVAYVQNLEIGNRTQSLAAKSTYLQQLLTDKLSNVITDTTARAIALAMFLGDKTQLSKEIRTAFSVAGASHVLAISGMHIGIIYLILQGLLSWLHMLYNGKRIKYAIILALLLGYMCMTGASPAVVRATLMFSILLIFKIGFLRYHILNVIALTAFIQLLWDPNSVFTLSFQLSYVAVTGIVILFPYFEQHIQTPWKIVNHFYSWIGISLCATLVTAPLVLLNFGTFPVHFLLTNVCIAFLSVAIVWSGFITVMCLYIPTISIWLGSLSELLISWMYDIIAWIAQLPHAQFTTFSLQSPSLHTLILEIGIAIVLLAPGFWWQRKLLLKRKIS